MDRPSRVFVIAAVAALTLALAVWLVVFANAPTGPWNSISPVGSQGSQYVLVHG